MADYIYTMETRLTPEQQRTVSLVQDVARNQETNLYVTGGTTRDLISGFAIRELEFTVQGNALKLQKELEKAGAEVEGADDDYRVLYLVFSGNVRAQIRSALAAAYDKPGKPPRLTPGTINEDLRRRDFTVNAMALSLNTGSRGLLLDPFNGIADIEGKLIRILHNYAFLEEPVRLIRATRLLARFHWPMEERTQARYESAKENSYIEYINSHGLGEEIEALAHEEDPLNILRALEKEGWLKVLNAHWTVAKVDTTGLSELVKTRQQMAEFGINVDPSAAVMYFLTRRLGDADIRDLQKQIPRKKFVETWRNLEDDAAKLAKRLSGKEAATPSRAWQVLSEAPPETLLFLAATTKQQSVEQKIKNFFGKWRQVRQKLPLPEMAELRIVPGIPEYPKVEREAFYLLLDGKLRSRTEILKFLKPYSPPPPPPPPPPTKKGKAAKAEAAAAAAAAAAQPAVLTKKGRRGRPPAQVAQAVAIKVAEKVEEAVKPPPVKPVVKPAPKPAAAHPVKPAPKPKQSKKPVHKPVKNKAAAKKK